MYDRRALDTSAPLPLFNSLTHLVYLTSTSPRIREIMTQDGGLERLVRMLHDYCMSPTPPENPASIYGLTPPNARPPKPVPTLNPTSFDKHAAYRFSLAFQCVVNIGVRGSEQIRTRVVQAGTLDVVGCVLEAWLASKGFAVGPSASVTGAPRETREQRNARKLAQMEQRQREEAAQLQRALQRQLQMDQRRVADESMDVSPSHASTPGANSDTDMSTDNSIAATPLGSGTPTSASSVVIPARDRSGTLLARPEQARDRNTSPVPSTDNSRAETETEDDGEPDMMDMDGPSASSTTMTTTNTTSRTHRRMSTVQHRHNLGITNNEHDAQGPDAHIIINQGGGSNPEGVGMGDVVEVAGVDDGMEMGMGMVEASVTNNDDFAMGAPPGAPGAIGLMNAAGLPPDREMSVTPDPLVQETVVPTMRTTVEAPDVTPRAGIVGLPHEAPTPMVGVVVRRDTIRPHDFTPGPARPATTNTTPALTTTFPASRTNTRDSTTTEPAASSSTGQTLGPYRDEDVLFGLQLLAYLSKYPHVRQAFYKPRASFHPAAATGSGNPGSSSRWGNTTASSNGKEKEKEKDVKEKVKEATSGIGTAQNYLRNLAGNLTGSSRSKEKASSSSQQSGTTNPAIAGPSTTSQPATPLRQTNVFSLVERFTFKPSSSEIASASSTSTNDGGSQYQGPQELPEEIQYWAGVIMRNACRKDETRGGIRQCANMLCGRWESYPREFAKCRRCRKAKYCGKECQSTAWSEGHRFWCSTKDSSNSHSHSHSTQHGSHRGSDGRGNEDDDDEDRPATTGSRHRYHRGIAVNQDGTRNSPVPVTVSVPGTATGRRERRDRDRDRDREQRRAARSTASNATITDGVGGARAGVMTAPTPLAPRAEQGMSRDRTLQPTSYHPPRTMPDPLTIPTQRGLATQGHGRVSMFHSILGGDTAPMSSPTSPRGSMPMGSQTGTMRRRAETITPSSAGTMSLRTGDVPPRPQQQRRGDDMEERGGREDGMVLG